MRRSVFLRRYFGKFTVAVILVGLIVYTVFHASGAASSSLLTTPTRAVTDTQILGGEAYLFRDETVLRSDQRGLVQSLAENGSKVGKDVAIAQIWTDHPTDTLAERQRTLDRLNRTIGVLQRAVTNASEPVSNAQIYKGNADAEFLSIRRAIEMGDFSTVSTLEDEMLANLLRYQSIASDREAVNQLLKNALEERSALLGSSYVEALNTVSSGYYYDRSFVDGGEEIFTLDALETITPQSLDALNERFEATSDAGFSIGKMAYRYDWHIAVVINGAIEGLLTVGESYRTVFSENSDLTLTLVCKSIVTDADGRSIAVLQANETPKDFSYLRRQHVEIEVDSCKGYYVPEQALTVQNGEDGVFIFENSTVYFRRINILYRGDGYVIAEEQGEQGDSYLALNDIIVTSGKNMYDGRVYQ